MHISNCIYLSNYTIYVHLTILKKYVKCTTLHTKEQNNVLVHMSNIIQGGQKKCMI